MSSGDDRTDERCDEDPQRGGPSAEQPPTRAKLVRLAEDLQAAIASNDLGLAIEAHHALGEQLEHVEGDERVVDLARERARRRKRR